jgi:hypothetical protein
MNKTPALPILHCYNNTKIVVKNNRITLKQKIYELPIIS